MPVKKKTLKRPSFPPWVVTIVWTRAAGRCQFLDCNKPLWKDLLTKTVANFSYIAHIISWKPEGPRGDAVLSPKLAVDPKNLMLMCDVHHRMIDNKKNLWKYTVQLLTSYKSQHEKRIETLTGIKENKKTTVLVVQAPIGPHDDPINVDDVKSAVAANGRYPEELVLPVNVSGIGTRDDSRSFWKDSKRMISEQVRAQLQAARHRGPIDHLSVFALGPIPLLTQLGLEIGDKVETDVYNLSRQPKGWKWPNDHRRFKKVILKAPTRKDTRAKDACVVISVTSSVQEEHVKKVAPPGCPWFELRFEKPNIDLIRSAADLAVFVRKFHEMMEEVHDKVPNAERIHVFTGVPVAVAVEIGRSQLPKRHAKLILYDFNRATNGMTKVMELGGQKKKPKRA